MNKKFYKYRKENKHYVIKDISGFFYENGCQWNDDIRFAKVGTKREMTILLNKKLYQSKIRGAIVVSLNQI